MDILRWGSSSFMYRKVFTYINEFLKGERQVSKKNARWRKLDNAAKLYSAASNKKDTRVFRFYCELKEEVDPDVLQEALNQTIETFPTFLMVLRKGLFWHYLEPCNLRPIVKEEYKEPCSRLYIRDKKTLLFEVTYYKKNESTSKVFHVLTDGTGDDKNF